MDTKMRKSWMTMLCLLLALCLLPVAGAMAQGAGPGELFGSRLLDAQEQVQNVAMVDGRVYMLSNKAFYSFAPGDSEAQYLAEADRVNSMDDQPAVSSIFAHEGRLKGLNGQTGQIYGLQFKDGKAQYEPLLKLDLSRFEESAGDSSYVDEFRRMVVLDDLIFGKLGNWGGDKEKDLYSYDLNTGEMKAHTPQHLQALVPYKEGKLIGIMFDQNRQGPDGGQMDGELTVFDPSSDKTEKLDWQLPEDPQGKNRDLIMYYDQATDSLYAATLSGLVRLSADKAPELLARLPLTGSWSGFERGPSMLPWAGGQMLVAFSSNVFIRSTDPSQMKPVTTLYSNQSFYGSNALSKTLTTLDDIDLKINESGYLDSAAISTQFLTGEMAFDLLSLYSTEFDMQKMMQKGYLLDLSGQQELADYAADVHETLRPLIYDEGKLYAIPINLQTYYLSASVKNFREIGREIPTSIPELIELTRWWAQVGHAQHEGVVLFEQADAKRQLQDIVHMTYVDTLSGEGKPLQFDMAVFGELMKLVDAIDYETFDLKHSDLDEEASGMMPGRPLLTSYMGYDAGYPRIGEEYEKMMELSLDGQRQPWREGNAVFIAIPATSKHQEAALKFLAAYVHNQEPILKAGMSKSWAQAVPNPNYEYEYKQQEYYYELYKQRLASITEEGPQKRAAEEDVKNMAQALENMEKNSRYLVTSDVLKQHQAMMARVYMNGSLGMVQRQALVKDAYLVGMYQEGAITLEQFIQQANDRIRLMTLEAQ